MPFIEPPIDALPSPEATNAEFIIFYSSKADGRLWCPVGTKSVVIL